MCKGHSCQYLGDGPYAVKVLEGQYKGICKISVRGTADTLFNERLDVLDTLGICQSQKCLLSASDSFLYDKAIGTLP